ncbi:MAG: CbrC family protein [Armatimonadota bacterium]
MREFIAHPKSQRRADSLLFEIRFAVAHHAVGEVIDRHYGRFPEQVLSELLPPSTSQEQGGALHAELVDLVRQFMTWQDRPKKIATALAEIAARSHNPDAVAILRQRYAELPEQIVDELLAYQPLALPPPSDRVGLPSAEHASAASPPPRLAPDPQASPGQRTAGGEPMAFVYFQASPEEMDDWIEDGPRRCDLCGRVGDCFVLDSASCSEIPEDRRENSVGCYACLREGRFEFWHDTEAGLVDEDGLHDELRDGESAPVYPVDAFGFILDALPSTSTPKSGIPPEAIVELRRTPTWSSWQGSVWLCHCDDFMVYLGEWIAADFREQAADGDGRGLFLAMTDPDLALLWTPDEVEPEWTASYYAFRCRHCGTLRGYWDSS